MSWLGWGSSTNPQYEELVEKACSSTNLPYPQSEDIATSLEITDMIRSKAVQAKPAMQSLRTRIVSPNGRIQMYALALTDVCIKNGGDHFLAEIASKEFVDGMSGLIRSPVTNVEVRQMALKLFQSWAVAFQPKRELTFLVDVYHELKNAGVSFPPPPSQTSSHLLTTTTAPAWVDSDVCMRCRATFTFTNRKHHCRNCGLVFDQQCSSHTMPIPRYGVKEEVRVCEGCWTKAGKGVNADAATPTVTPAIPGRTPRSRADFDADLQKAIEMSLADSRNGPSSYVGSEPPVARVDHSVEDDDEELRLAIEASLREMENRPSAPQGSDEPEYKPLPTFDLAPREAETILTFSNTLDQMAAYGERDLRRFPHAHILYEQAYAVGGKLQRNAEEKTTKQQMLAEMQAKLSEAVGMYGQILDGQQAYSAQRLQGQQQQQYLRHMYGSAPAQIQHQAYAPQVYENRYSSAGAQMNVYAPPYQNFRPPQAQPSGQAKAGASLYPTMPMMNPAQSYVPQTYHTPNVYAPESSTSQDFRSSAFALAAQDPYATVSPAYPLQMRSQAPSSPPQNGFDRHSSMRVDPNIAHPASLQRHASLTYGATPQSSEPEGYVVGHFNPAAPDAPPPVDLSSHPNSSPTTSILSALPNGSAPPQSYASPRSAAAVPLPISPPPQQPLQQYQTWHHQAPVQQHQPHAFTHLQQHQLSQSAINAQPSQHQPPQHLYNAASFPAAPAAVFPNAPSGDFELQQGVEQKEQEEALLIEL